MKKKIIAIALCAALAAGGVMAGSLAYLTDTEAVTNTFTVGNVEIVLNETDVDTAGKKDSDARVTENEYHLLPGHTYTKDPTVHVDEDSEDCYVFVTVKNDIADIECDEDNCDKIAVQMQKNGWILLKDGEKTVQYDVDDTDAVNLVDVYAYKTTVAKNAADKDLKVFSQFKIDGDVTNTQLAKYATVKDDTGKVTGGKYVTVTAYAVQADGFTTPLEAWNASFGKTTNG